VAPLSQNEILILAALGTNEHYGREIVEEIERITDGRHKLSIGGLYTTLHRLEKKKLITGRWGEKRAAVPDAQRRYYRVSSQGRRILIETRQALITALKVVPARAGFRG
jgi:PadR family transcriptional regulator PadR